MPYQIDDAIIVLFLPPALAEPINAIRRAYDPYLHTIEPHISIFYPPFVRAPQWTARRAAAVKTLARIPRFTLALREVGCFTQPGKVMWLKPEDDGSIVRIEAALRAAYPDIYPDEPPKPGTLPFHPHATLGFFKDDAGLNAAMAHVRSVWQPGEFTVEAASYCTLDKSGRWLEQERMPLKSR